MSELDRDIMRVLPDAATQDNYLTTPEIHRRATQDALKPVTVKTVNRHLVKLEAGGLVEVRERGAALEWRRKAGASGMAARAAGMMTFDEALALQTLRRFSSRQIPELVADALSSMFEVAKTRLERSNNDVERRYARWASKVAVESGGSRSNIRPSSESCSAWYRVRFSRNASWRLSTVRATMLQTGSRRSFCRLASWKWAALFI
jgi:hypothetical protein